MPSNVLGGFTSHLGGDVTFCTATIHNLTRGIELPGCGYNINHRVLRTHSDAIHFKQNRCYTVGYLIVT